jgi:hypothetical protein
VPGTRRGSPGRGRCLAPDVARRYAAGAWHEAWLVGTRPVPGARRRVRVGCFELDAIVDAVGELGELGELYPGVPAEGWEPYCPLCPNLFTGRRWRLPAPSRGGEVQHLAHGRARAPVGEAAGTSHRADRDHASQGPWPATPRRRAGPGPVRGRRLLLPPPADRPESVRSNGPLSARRMVAADRAELERGRIDVPAAGRAEVRVRPRLVPLQAIRPSLLARDHAAPEPTLVLTKAEPALAADECELWLGARDPEAGQHYLKEHA